MLHDARVLGAILFAPREAAWSQSFVVFPLMGLHDELPFSLQYTRSLTQIHASLDTSIVTSV